MKLGTTSAPFREKNGEQFEKMESRQVWRKVQRRDMEQGRRCVKHKWVFEIKRDGRFRARLVACGYSQIPGVDFNDVFSPVGHDVTFRLMVTLNRLSC